MLRVTQHIFCCLVTDLEKVFKPLTGSVRDMKKKQNAANTLSTHAGLTAAVAEALLQASDGG